VYPDLGFEVPMNTWNDDPLGIRSYTLQMTMLHLLIYLVASLILIWKSFKSLGISFFSKRKPPISWLRNFIFLMFVMLVSAGVASSFKLVDMGLYIVGTVISLIIYATSFNVIRASDFFQESVTDPFNPKKKYEKSTLQEEEMAQILKGLKKCMEEEKDYKNHLLSLSFIAKKLNTSPHNISQVINEKMNLSFYEMLAKYRVEESKLMLLDSTQHKLTIEDVADEVGYNSKSSFNRSFKKIEGLTPSEFRDLHL
jgi:AraC-like DNA-binding protein